MADMCKAVIVYIMTVSFALSYSKNDFSTLN